MTVGAQQEGAPLTGPRTLHVDVVNACNTDCLTCWDHSPLLTTPRPADWKRRRLDPGVLAALLDDALGLGGLEAVILSGMGEPFVHPEIELLAAMVKARGLRLTIITNLLRADPERIAALCVDELLVGVHAGSAAAYRAFHPSARPDDWAALQAKLHRLAAAGCRVKHVHVICAVNAGELAAMVELGHRLAAAEVAFKLASLGRGTERCGITAGQREALATSGVPGAVALAARLGVRTNLAVLARQLEAGGAATAPIAQIGCYQGRVYARVAVDGTVYFCCNTETRVGALGTDGSFADLWRGPAWQAWRERLDRGDYLPSCGQCGKLAQNVKLRARLDRERREGRPR